MNLINRRFNKENNSINLAYYCYKNIKALFIKINFYFSIFKKTKIKTIITKSLIIPIKYNKFNIKIEKIHY